MDVRPNPFVAGFFSPQLNATRRWFFIAGVSIQPSELAKLALIPFLAYQIERKQERVSELSFLLPAAFFTVLTAALILLEPDMGTAVLLCATFFMMIFLAGLSWRYIVAALALVPPALIALVMMAPYRRARLFTFLDPERDPLGNGFQALQSLIAVGSGGVFGLGPGKSVQKLFFLPHPESDFIFSIVAMIPPFGSNHFLSAARQPPRNLLSILISAGRTGKLFLNCAKTFLSTGR